MESGVLNAEHIENVFLRILHPAPTLQTVETALIVSEPPLADTGRYERLRKAEADHA